MTARQFATLEEWLAWQEKLHHSKIDLGLERVAEVAGRLLEIPPDFPVITVAGTNGKGSVCAYLSAILTAAGFQTGVFSSPHLQRYNERVAIGGRFASDEALINAFERIDAMRAGTSITYFEFSTLAALCLFSDASVDCAILEVGMGGRLDAVNIIDADVAVITNIGLDHQRWLGTDREQIAREKAGIMRPRRPAVAGDRDPPARLLAEAQRIGAQLSLLGRDFDVVNNEESWDFVGSTFSLRGLPYPRLQGSVQTDNAALAIAALRALGDRFPLAVGHIVRGLRTVALPGRIQQSGDSPAWVLDVCHNAESAAVLASWLAATPCKGKTHLVLGVLKDKDVAAMVQVLAAEVDTWYAATLTGERGLTGSALCAVIADCPGNKPVSVHASVQAACEAAAAAAESDDRIVVCGSFHTVGEALALGL